METMVMVVIVMTAEVVETGIAEAAAVVREEAVAETEGTAGINHRGNNSKRISKI
jgi:hypothetical protein